MKDAQNGWENITMQNAGMLMLMAVRETAGLHENGWALIVELVKRKTVKRKTAAGRLKWSCWNVEWNGKK